MKPLILTFQEKATASIGSSLGTKTFTEAREGQDNDFGNNHFFAGEKTLTATRENVDDAI